MDHNTQHHNTWRILAIIFFAIALILGVLFVKSNGLVGEYQGNNMQAGEDQYLGFASLFIDKVLESDGEIDFETRLQLENAVRALEDEEILIQWQAFVESESESNAQEAVKDLLKSLIQKAQ